MKRFMGIASVVFSFFCCGIAVAEDDAKIAIEKSIKSYVAAFNARDAESLAAHWSPEGVYVSRVSGEQTVGRDALREEFKLLFENEKGTTLAVVIDSIELISPNVALERGSAVVARKGAEPEETTYRVVHVQRDGKWLIDRVTEEMEPAEPQSHYEHLKDLDWMVGEWLDDGDGAVVKTECHWTKNKNYLIRSFTVSVDERVDLSGMQFVSWDAAKKQIRSWVFDSEGGHAEGVWQMNGKRWVINAQATLPDGRRASSTSILRPIDNDQFTWQKINRVVDGEILPNGDEIIFVRQ